jgi:hypothetical protein
MILRRFEEKRPKLERPRFGRKARKPIRYR